MVLLVLFTSLIEICKRFHQQLIIILKSCYKGLVVIVFIWSLLLSYSLAINIDSGFFVIRFFLHDVFLLRVILRLLIFLQLLRLCQLRIDFFSLLGYDLCQRLAEKLVPQPICLLMVLATVGNLPTTAACTFSLLETNRATFFKFKTLIKVREVVQETVYKHLLLFAAKWKLYPFWNQIIVLDVSFVGWIRKTGPILFKIPVSDLKDVFQNMHLNRVARIIK